MQVNNQTKNYNQTKKLINNLKLTTMKNTTTNRMMMAMIAVIFAVATTSCKKENDVAPNPNPSVNTPPNVPVTPPVALSAKPKFILTKQNGSTIRKEVYKYDAQGKLTTYESHSLGSEVDSAIMLINGVLYKRNTPTASSFVQLKLNTDKTFDVLVNATFQANFQNNGAKLLSASQNNAAGTATRIADFTYVNNNLSQMKTEVAKYDINYFNDLPYQKGINEIPKNIKPITLFKVMEQESATTTILYSKLIRNVIISRGSQVIETHDYTYVLDANNRVTKITDLITDTTNGTQKTSISTIEY